MSSQLSVMELIRFYAMSYNQYTECTTHRMLHQSYMLSTEPAIELGRELRDNRMQGRWSPISLGKAKPTHSVWRLFAQGFDACHFLFVDCCSLDLL